MIDPPNVFNAWTSHATSINEAAVIRRAVRAVASHAHDAADAAHLLTTLGLDPAAGLTDPAEVTR